MQWTASNKVKCSGYAFKVLHLSYPKFECITRVYYQDLQEKIHTGQTISKCCVQFRVQINSLEKKKLKTTTQKGVTQNDERLKATS